jgi:hypothetical protein
MIKKVKKVKKDYRCARLVEEFPFDGGGCLLMTPPQPPATSTASRWNSSGSTRYVPSPSRTPATDWWRRLLRLGREKHRPIYLILIYYLIIYLFVLPQLLELLDPYFHRYYYSNFGT